MSTVPKSWPFEQARALLERVQGKETVIFETGFGPSGTPHIGTFAEVIRTSMVRRAFEEMTNEKVLTRLLVFSDDYDGFRKRPLGLPVEMEEDFGLPLTRVRDPDGAFPSFAERNNQALRDFLDKLEVGYEFVSSTECYKTGVFDDVLMRVAENYDAVQEIMLPSLRDERRATYSAFMPISPVTGRVLAEGVHKVTPQGMVFFDAEDGKRYASSVRGGLVKLQWKVDWALRWAHFGVDYEMHGKDLIESAKLSERICKAVGGVPPLTYFYEMFLDDNGEKFSKSKGNGFTVEDWQRYSSTGALAHFVFQTPKSAKTLSASVVPRVTDEYLKALAAFPKLEGAARLDSPVWHIHEGSPPSYSADVSYGLLLNLAGVSKAQEPEVLENYLRQYKALGDDREFITSLIPGAIAYTNEQTKPAARRQPNQVERVAFQDLIARLEKMDDGLDGEAYQFEVYEVGKTHGFESLRAWFQGIYEVLFGESQGPRFGSFIAAYGRRNTINLLWDALVVPSSKEPVSG